MYKKTGLTLEEFEGNRYKRIDHIRLLMSGGEISNALRWQATAKMLEMTRMPHYGPKEPGEFTDADGFVIG